MKNYIFIAVIVLASAIYGQRKTTDYVNPMVGTDGHGHTYPGAAYPFGLVQLSPDTDIEGWDWCSGYHYSDNSIMGFSHTHLSGTGCNDYGDILFMPTTGVVKTVPGKKTEPGTGYRSRFSHSTETAKPGYYSVLLDDYNIKAELTVTKHAGFHKYTFLSNEKRNIILDLIHGIGDKSKNCEITVINKNTIQGSRRSTGWADDHTVYFYAEFSKPFASFGLLKNGTLQRNSSSVKGENLTAYFNFNNDADKTVLMKVGISHTSIKGAKLNVKSEITDWNFNKIAEAADQEWQKQLSAIDVTTKIEKYKNVFYTSLYHSLLNPNAMSDIDSTYTGMDKKIHKAKWGDMYTVYSLWDTFRAAHPLITLLDRKKANDMVSAMIAKYDESGFLPIWELASNETGTMIGIHSIPVIVDAYMKGIKNFDAAKAFTAIKKSLMQDKNGLKFYKAMGYISSDLDNESVSKTLEYAYDDWCAAKLAKELGYKDDYNYFIGRAKNYLNVFDPTVSLMRGKKNGKWYEPFVPTEVNNNYTEGNAWQYSFFVPQDVNGLINAMGGDGKFISKLDELFDSEPVMTGRVQSDITGLIGQYAHGNEPSHHMAYLYSYAGAPWKTAEKVNKIVTKLYSDKVDGLCGNEDCGQMSAWYVFSSLGFYPVCPGDNNYVIGTPLFEKAVIKNSGKPFVITANNLSDDNIYIQSAKLNGKDYPYSYITQDEIVNGGEIVFEMGSEPSEWGSVISARPVSKIEENIVTVPFLTRGDRVYNDSEMVSLASVDSSVILYTTDGSDPVVKGKVYLNDFYINRSLELKAVCVNNGVFSKTINAVFNKIPQGRSVKLFTEYAPSYTGGGALGLVDGIKGTDDFHTDAWQGYHGADLNAVIDLGKIEKVSTLSASFLQNQGAWIFYPKEVDFYVSSDGINYTACPPVKYEIKKNDPSGIREFTTKIKSSDARFIRVIAKNIGILPQWHIGAGNAAWIFTDEVTVK